MEAPLEIPIQSKNSRIVRLQQQSRSSALLVQRTESETRYFNVPKTIRKAVDNFGLLFPEYSHRYKDRDYLVLIDATNSAGSQYVPLFTYLIKAFVSDNVTLS